MAQRATRKKTTRSAATNKGFRVTVEPPDDGTDEDPVREVEEPKTEEEREIEDVLETLPEDSRVELAKWDNANGGAWGYCARYPITSFDMETVKADHGPGKYRMIIRAPKDGRMRMRGKRQFVIAGVPSGPGGGSGNLVERGVLELVKLQSDIFRSQMTQPRESMADVVKAVAELMRPARSEQAPADPFKMALEIMQLMGKTKDKDPVETALSIIQLSKELNDGGGGGDGMSAFAGEFAKLLGRVSEAPPARQTDPKPAQKALPAGEATPATDATTRELWAWFSSTDVILAKAAERHGDHDLYADWLADQLPELLEPYLDQWFADPAYPDTIVGYFPNVDAQWLRIVLLKMRAALSDDEETGGVDDDRGAAGARGRGDSPDVTGDAAARPRQHDRPGPTGSRGGDQPDSGMSD